MEGTLFTTGHRLGRRFPGRGDSLNKGQGCDKGMVLPTKELGGSHWRDVWRQEMLPDLVEQAWDCSGLQWDGISGVNGAIKY